METISIIVKESLRFEQKRLTPQNKPQQTMRPFLNEIKQENKKNLACRLTENSRNRFDSLNESYILIKNLFKSLLLPFAAVNPLQLE